MSSPIADDISARLPASSQVMILLGKTFLHSEPRLTALRRPLSLRFRQVHSPLLRSYVLPATRDPRLYPTADNDHDVHEYVCVLHLTQLHAFRPLSDRSLDRNYHVVPISDAFPWMHRSMYVSTRMPSIIPTVPSCTRLWDISPDCSQRSRLFCRQCFLSSSRHRSYFSLQSESTLSYSTVTRWSYTSQFRPVYVQRFSFAASQGLSFLRHLSSYLIDATDHAFNAFLVFDPSCQSTICFACSFYQLARLTQRLWLAKPFLWRLITAEVVIIFVLRLRLPRGVLWFIYFSFLFYTFLPSYSTTHMHHSLVFTFAWCNLIITGSKYAVYSQFDHNSPCYDDVILEKKKVRPWTTNHVFT